MQLLALTCEPTEQGPKREQLTMKSILVLQELRASSQHFQLLPGQIFLQGNYADTNPPPPQQKYELMCPLFLHAPFFEMLPASMAYICQDFGGDFVQN